jgi:CheY-like chemotaxis protein
VPSRDAATTQSPPGLNSAGIATLHIVEDDPKQIRLCGRVFAGCRLTFVNTGTAALAALEPECPHVIILAHTLAGGELGTDFLPQIKARAAHVPVIVITGTLGLAGLMAALSGPLAAHYVLCQPVALEELEAAVETPITECGFGETVQMLRSLEAARRGRWPANQNAGSPSAWPASTDRSSACGTPPNGPISRRFPPARLISPTASRCALAPGKPIPSVAGCVKCALIGGPRRRN